MDKTSLLTIFCSYGNLDVVQKTLPSVIDETLRCGTRLIVHDATEPLHGRDAKWAYLRTLEAKFGFILILSSNFSMAHSRNMCLRLGQELFLPDYVAMMEDDHGYKPGFIDILLNAMRSHYGKNAPNQFRYGIFTGCKAHRWVPDECIEGSTHRYVPIEEDTDPMLIGGVNSCFRAAPSHHWDHVLKGYDTDEYLISTHQTKNINSRNYHKGFTSLLVANGEFMFDVVREGRGWSEGKMSGLWDERYSASDPRSEFIREN